MRAVEIKRFGGLDVLEISSDAVLPTCGRSQVRIKVEYAGVNPCDTYCREGKVIVYELPFIPGFDGAGVVEECGANVTRFKVGDRVYFCGPNSGSYAEYFTAEECHTFKLHDVLTFSQGAAIGVPYFTAYRALVTKAQARSGQSVLIHGASGAVGIACCQIANRLRLEVFGTAGTEAGLELIKKHGVSHAFNHNSKNYAEEMKKIAPCGMNIVIEMLANVNLARDIDLVSRFGKIVVVGSRGTINIDPYDIFSREISVTGVMLFSTSEVEWLEYGEFFDEGQKNGWLTPVTGKEFKLDEVKLAHKEVIVHDDGSHGKIVISIH